MSKVTAPWSYEQVNMLYLWQYATSTHPFTCCSHNGCERHKREDEGILIPSQEGWVCPCGSWKQDWCHDFMCTMPVFQEIPDVVQYLLAKNTLSRLLDLYCAINDNNMQLESQIMLSRLEVLQSYAMRLMQKVLEYEKGENNQQNTLDPQK